MLRRVVITDLTRMQGERVCIAGYFLDGDEANPCVRPELRYHPLTEGWLYANGVVVIQPFAIVELNLLEQRPQSPHTEDWLVDDRHRLACGLLSPEKRLELLAALDDGGIERIFGAPVHQDGGWFVRAGEGARSLGTIRPAQLCRLVYEPKPRWSAWAYRLEFADQTGHIFNLSVTDLAFRYYLNGRRDDDRMEPADAAHQLMATLTAADHLHLRIGLTRPWGERGDRCFLQVNGIYSFPDYLDGRSFADFAPAAPLAARSGDLPF